MRDIERFVSHAGAHTEDAHTRSAKPLDSVASEQRKTTENHTVLRWKSAHVSLLSRHRAPLSFFLRQGFIHADKQDPSVRPGQGDVERAQRMLSKRNIKVRKGEITRKLVAGGLCLWANQPRQAERQPRIKGRGDSIREKREKTKHRSVFRGCTRVPPVQQYKPLQRTFPTSIRVHTSKTKTKSKWFQGSHWALADDE